MATLFRTLDLSKFYRFQGNITNSSIVATNDANLINSNSESYVTNNQALRSNSGNINSQLLQQASLEGGEVNINAANNFENFAANIVSNKNTLADASTTSGDINIAAGNDINIETLQLRNRTEEHFSLQKTLTMT